MSRHVWLISTFEPRTVEEGYKAIQHEMKKGADYSTTCRFCGYYLESVRQKTYDISPDRLWNRATKSKNERSRHRYAKGKNGPQYEDVGRRMLEYNADKAGLHGAPAQAVWDKLMEEMPTTPTETTK